MILNKYPIFKSGNILAKEDFDLLRDNSINLFNLLYKDYYDGIINGFELIVNEKNKEIIITPGILKKNNKIVYMKKNYKIKIPEEENIYILKIKLDFNIKNKRYYIIKGDFILEKGEILEENEIEITRFITRIGAELRNNYKKFIDFKRDYNLLELINIKYSSKNIYGTLHPKILLIFKEEMLKKNKLDYLDNNFISLILNGLVERENIILYISQKLKIQNKNYSNEELYNKLLEILEKQEEKHEIIENKKIVPKKLMID